MDLALAALAFGFAAVPALLFVRNLSAYKLPPKHRVNLPGVSVLIPARNEERSIGAAVASVIDSTGVSFEVVVLDDGSTDATAFVVEAISAVDSRVKLLRGLPLPAGWCGKQYACDTLARSAKYPVICFMDADVCLRHDAIARMAAFLDASGAALASGVPHQETVTFVEKLLIPLIHFVLLGFLPVGQMRRSTHPAYAAGCGQLFIARAEAYKKAGGHGAIRATLHDGLNLPRAFRRAGLKTDLFDATSIATCRMYYGAAEVWRGLAKNATEGLGARSRIVPITLVLAIGQIAPLALTFLLQGLPRTISMAALSFAYLPRILAANRFRQSPMSVILHPIGVLLLLAIQWDALVRRMMGGHSHWKGRSYTGAEGAQPR